MMNAVDAYRNFADPKALLSFPSLAFVLVADHSFMIYCLEATQRQLHLMRIHFCGVLKSFVSADFVAYLKILDPV